MTIACRASGVAALSMAILSACSAGERTELVISVDTDIKVPGQMDGISFVVQNHEEKTVLDLVWNLDDRHAKANVVPLPAFIGLFPGRDLQRTITITVTRMSAGKRAPPERKARLSFVPDRILWLRMDLLSRCIALKCQPGETCTGERCEPIDIDSKSLGGPLLGEIKRRRDSISGDLALPPSDDRVVDGAVDSGAVDLAADGPPGDQQAARDRDPPDQRVADQRPPDQRVADQRPPDQRVADQRLPDQRVADQRPPDQRPPDLPAPDAAPPDQYVVPDADAFIAPDQWVCLTAQAQPSCRIDALGKWCTIKGGCFTMGSPASDRCRDNDEVQHLVGITRAFEISAAEVTQAQFNTLMGYDPSVDKSCGPTCPVEAVTWHEAAAYCNALSAKVKLTPCYKCSGSGKGADCALRGIYTADYARCRGYRLPSEAEWEYAARGGTSTDLYSGALPNCIKHRNAASIAWYGGGFGGNSGDKKHPVGGLQPNLWGLWDMSGNVWEWTYDGAAAYDTSKSPALDPFVNTGTQRIIRGGDWHYEAKLVRSANRAGRDHKWNDKYIGFRCARTL